MTDSTQPIVVGVDGTGTPIGAVRWAAAVADKYGAPLHIVHATRERRRLISDAAAAIEAAAIAARRAWAQTALKSVESDVRAEFGTLSVTTTCTGDYADKVLIDLSRRAQLVVLGCDELSPAAALLVGSTTISVVTHARCPVVAWRGDVVRPTSHSILLGVDGVGTGTSALTNAFEFADRFGLGVTAVHAWSAFRPPADVANPYLIDWVGLEAAQQQELMDVVEPWAVRYPDVKVTYLVDPDRPSGALLRHVADSQLVVVGNRGRGLIAGTVLGSTSLNLLHHSPVPVMVCRTITAER